MTAIHGLESPPRTDPVKRIRLMGDRAIGTMFQHERNLRDHIQGSRVTGTTIRTWWRGEIFYQERFESTFRRSVEPLAVISSSLDNSNLAQNLRGRTLIWLNLGAQMKRLQAGKYCNCRGQTIGAFSGRLPVATSRFGSRSLCRETAGEAP